MTFPRSALEGTEPDEREELELDMNAKCSLQGAELENMELDELEELRAELEKLELDELDELELGAGAELEKLELDELEELELAGDTETVDVKAVGDLPLDVAICCDSCSDLVCSASSKSLKNKVAQAR
jgi:hypothetical protein